MTLVVIPDECQSIPITRPNDSNEKGGGAAEDSGGRQRFPAAVAARHRCVASTAGAQSLLQGTGKLDRLQAEARGAY